MLKIEKLKPLKVKLYVAAKNRGRHYLCLVFSDQHELRHYALELAKLAGEPIAKECNKRYWKHTLGLAKRYSFYRGHKSDNIGCVLLCPLSVTAAIVSHEMTHAALYEITNNFRIAITEKNDEKLAWLQGRLVDQFWRWFWRQVDKQKRGSKCRK